MKLIVATGNIHKAGEISAMLNHCFQILTLKDIGFREKIVENGKTFEDNARIKVKILADFLMRNQNGQEAVVLLADDSGLEVDALDGTPGVLSARYAGEPSNDKKNTQKLLKKLKSLPGSKRTARFRCVLAVMVLPAGGVPGGDVACNVSTFDGVCEGKIGYRPKGKHGFGYDPVFFPENFCRTFAELEEDEKNSISHRAKAMAKFKTWLELKAMGILD